MVGAVENRHLGTLHFHGVVFLANLCQFSTMEEIRKAIVTSPKIADAVKAWHSWVHREEHFDLGRHDEML
eukprot:3273430-Pyramimonas_sp.AAC.1